MHRRDCLFAATLSLLGVSGRGSAQQIPRRPLVGLLYGATRMDDMQGPNPPSPLARGFLQGMRDNGWSDGRTVTIERWSAEDSPEKAAKILQDLINRSASAIVLGTPRWLQDLAIKATPDIPLFAVFIDDPVAMGMVQSLAHPGRNLTGVSKVSSAGYFNKQIQLLREIKADINRIGFIGTRDIVRQYKSYLLGQDVQMVFAEVDFPSEYSAAFTRLRSSDVAALIVSGGALNYVNYRKIADLALELGVPSMFPSREAVDAGGLASFGPDDILMYKQITRQLTKVLKGTKIQDIPVEQPLNFDLFLNTKTAKALNIEIPASVLAQAEDSIEN